LTHALPFGAKTGESMSFNPIDNRTVAKQRNTPLTSEVIG